MDGRGAGGEQHPPPSQSTQRPPELQRGAQLCLCLAVRPGIGLGLRASPVVFLPGQLWGWGKGWEGEAQGKEVRLGRQGLGPGQVCVGDTGSLLCGVKIRVRQMRHSSWVHNLRRSQRSLSNQEKEYHNTAFLLNKKKCKISSTMNKNPQHFNAGRLQPSPVPLTCLSLISTPSSVPVCCVWQMGHKTDMWDPTGRGRRRD